MFIVSTKLTKAKAVAGVLAVGAVLCGLIFAAGHLHSRGAAAPSPEHVADHDGRVAYLAAWGWDVDPSAGETLDLVLPSSGASFESYNALQEENGMDLSAYGGQRAKRYTYTVLNYPGNAESVQANLYLCGDTVVAGDIIAPGPDGFIAALHYPK